MIYLRPHHSLCIQFFIGKGYSADFVNKLTDLKEFLDKNNPEICISDGCDSICSFCPNNINGICRTEDKVSSIDENCRNAMALSTGSEIMWKTLRDMAYSKLISMNLIPEICGDCQWKEICIKKQSRYLK